MRNLGGAMVAFGSGYCYLSHFSSGTATDISFYLCAAGFLIICVHGILDELRSIPNTGTNLKSDAIRFLIICFVSLTLLASLLYPAGKPHYRQREREAAMNAKSLNPSASTMRAVDEEFKQLEHHQKTVQLILIPSVLLFDAVVIYFFWNHGRRKTGVLANSPDPTPLAHPMN